MTAGRTMARLPDGCKRQGFPAWIHRKPAWRAMLNTPETGRLGIPCKFERNGGAADAMGDPAGKGGQGKASLPGR